MPFYIVIALYYNPLFPDKIKKKDYLWVVFFGFMGYYLASYFDFLGLQYIKAGLERIILFVYPTLVILISKIFLKEPSYLADLNALFIARSKRFL